MGNWIAFILMNYLSKFTFFYRIFFHQFDSSTLTLCELTAPLKISQRVVSICLCVFHHSKIRSVVYKTRIQSFKLIDFLPQRQLGKCRSHPPSGAFNHSKGFQCMRKDDRRWWNDAFIPFINILTHFISEWKTIPYPVCLFTYIRFLWWLHAITKPATIETKPSSTPSFVPLTRIHQITRRIISPQVLRDVYIRKQLPVKHCIYFINFITHCGNTSCNCCTYGKGWNHLLFLINDNRIYVN